MSLEQLIGEYGPVAVFLGAAVEGETAAFLGGVISHRGLMPYWQAAAGAFLGSLIADQALFFAGRHANRLSIVQRMMRVKAAERVRTLLAAHPTGFILSFRFIYGIRTVSPLMIGLSGISPLRFFFLNLIAAFVWGVGITAIGYLFGNAVEALFGHLRLHVHMLAALGVILVAVAVTAFLARKTLSRMWAGTRN